MFEMVMEHMQVAQVLLFPSSITFVEYAQDSTLLGLWSLKPRRQHYYTLVCIYAYLFKSIYYTVEPPIRDPLR